MNFGYHKIIMDIQKCILGYPQIDFWISIIHFWISKNRIKDIHNSFLDIHKSNYGYPIFN